MSGALFQGMVMVVDLTVKNEDNQEVEEVIKKDIHACGGEVVELSALNEKADYERLTHMIVTDLDKDVVKKARGHKLKVKAVTEWWVDQCIEKNQVLPTDAEVVYCPPNALGGIPLNEMKDLVVCVTGYSGFRRVVMRELVLRTGARYSGTLNRSCTHLVCYRYEGDKYVTAKKWKDNFGAPCIVNHRWVEDCLRTWTRLSELVYEEKCGEEVDKEPRVPLKELVKLEAVQNSEDEVGSEDEEDEAGAGHRSSRYAANRHSNRQQPCKDKAQLEETVAVPDANTLKKVDPDTNRKQKQVAQVVDDPAGAPPSPLSPPEDEKEKVLELPEDTTMEMVQEIPLGEEEDEPKEIEEIVVRKRENSPPENVAEDDVARRRLRELKNLQLFSWDVQSTKFPPGEKLSNSVGNLARKRVQPERLEPENFSVEPSKKRKGMKAVNGHGKENVSTSCQQPKKRNKKGAKTNATAAKVRAMDGSKSEHFRVLLSGMRSKVRARCEKYSQKCDGVQIIESPKEWNHGTTHLVTPKLGRSEKTLAGMAAASSSNQPQRFWCPVPGCRAADRTRHVGFASFGPLRSHVD